MNVTTTIKTCNSNIAKTDSSNNRNNDITAYSKEVKKNESCCSRIMKYFNKSKIDLPKLENIPTNEDYDTVIRNLRVFA